MTRLPDPIRLEVFHQLLAAICDESGALLRRCAASPNIRERLDFSCALYDGAGRLVSQAEHIPVHLGSAADSVAAARAASRLQPGDVVVLNDPYAGGTHLPDVTMVRPIFLRRRRLPEFFAVNRAHHADIGGGTPGSMGVAHDLFAEGLVIPPVKLRAAGKRVGDVVRLLLANVRGARERAIDLEAQEAALACAERRLRAMVDDFGLATVQAYSGHLMDYTERLLVSRLRTMPRGRYRAEEWLESDGTGGGPFRLTLDLDLRGDTIEFDFRRCAPQARGGINCNRSVVLAACAYVVRALLPSRLPTNDGLYRRLRVHTRPGTLLEPRAPAPVAGGNVETSQRLVDLVLRALSRALPGRIPAASAGTMTNLAVGGRDAGGEDFSFYETLPGGGGATATAGGTSGVQTHMTNTRNTPIEDFEARYPLRVESLTLRRGSGGRGARRGGDGVVKRLRALTDGVSVSLFAERHVRRPWGLAGGGDGAAASAHVERRGVRVPLPAKGSVVLAAGDAVEVETPGGGGYGRHR
ncbi:MAG: hydantoinase B/oxoprolinase family protein [Planctomycetota bacterium]